MESRGSRHTLILRRVGREDFANYSCYASNKLGKARAYLTLRGERGGEDERELEGREKTLVRSNEIMRIFLRLSPGYGEKEKVAGCGKDSLGGFDTFFLAENELRREQRRSQHQ